MACLITEKPSDKKTHEFKTSKKNYDMETKLNEIRVIQHAWITMSDGVRLSAKIWLPKNSHKNTAPAIL